MIPNWKQQHRRQKSQSQQGGARVAGRREKGAAVMEAARPEGSTVDFCKDLRLCPCG